MKLKKISAFKNFIKNYPFTTGLILTCIVFLIIELASSDTALKKNIEEEKGKFKSATVSSQIKSQDVAKAEAQNKTTDKKEPKKEDKINKAEEKIEEIKKEAIAEIPKEAPKDEKLNIPEPDSLYKTIDQNYFNDALFIGDSRTICLQAYGGWNNATYYTEQGVSIWKIMDETVAPLSNGTKGTIRAALSERQFKKIYIMLGINELATGTADTFFAQYKKVVDEISTLQPNSIIYVQSIIHVSQAKSDSDKYLKNSVINERNLKLASLADYNKIYFIDANKVLDDETGNLKAEYSFDGVHLKANYLNIWKDFLLKHGIDIIPAPTSDQAQIQQ